MDTIASLFRGYNTAKNFEHKGILKPAICKDHRIFFPGRLFHRQLSASRATDNARRWEAEHKKGGVPAVEALPQRGDERATSGPTQSIYPFTQDEPNTG